MTTEMRRVGRPKGSGINDDPVLTKVAAMLAINIKMRPTTAIKRILPKVTDSELRRLQIKWKACGENLIARLRAERTVSRGSRVREFQEYGRVSTGLASAELERRVNTLASSLATQELGSIYSNTAIKTLQNLANSPSMRAARALSESPTMKAIEALQNSPSMRALLELQGTPAFGVLSSLRNTSVGRVSHALALKLEKLKLP